MAEYTQFDMSELRRDISTAVTAEQERIQKESSEKLRKIRENMERINGLRSDQLVSSSKLDGRKVEKFREQQDDNAKLIETEKQKENFLR